MKSNFSFIEKTFPIIAEIGETAENYLDSDANSCMIKLGLLGEAIVNIMLKLDGIDPPESDNTHANRIKLLRQNGLLPRDIDDILYLLRTKRNKAVHENYDSFEDCQILLEMAYNLAVWFMQTYGDWEYKAEVFVMPEDNRSNIDYEKLLEEKEELIKKLTEENEKIVASQTISVEERAKQARTAADNINLSEKETRFLIDEQLRKVGWEADTVKLRYSKDTRPQKGRNIAIAEWPTDSAIGKNGYADYALFVGLKLVGIIEAKRQLVDVPSVLDYQCKDYAKEIKEEHGAYIINSWNEYKVPFLFATNGRKYLKQLETKSGVWFLDARKNSNIPKALQGWISPDGIIDLLKKDITNANKALEETPYDLLWDKDGLNLRPYQIEAVNAAEKAIVDGKDTVLLSMATGTGKTYVYIRTILELHKNYGFSKFIIVVPSIAIKEGVYKSLQITKDHFNDLYDNTIYNYFVYDSGKLEQVRSFAVSDNIEIMVINIDAFRRSFTDPTKENKANIIHRPNDRLNGMKPIELIQETRPFVIIDEPQSVDTTPKSKEAIKSLNPLCTLRYSATHVEKHNLVYKLDAVDSYNLELVKQIEVAGFATKDYHNKAYLKLLSVNNKKSPITARVEIDVKK